MTGQALDDLARRVMLDAARQEYGGLMAEMPEHDFSPDFEKKMRRLVRQANHPIRYRFVQTVACFLLAALLCGCTVLAVSQEARAAFVGWIRELHQEWFSYHYAGGREDAPRRTVYYPAELPNGYRELEAPKLGAFVHALYEGEDGSLLSFAYQLGTETMTFHVEWEDAEIQQVMVSSTNADFYQNDMGGSNVLVWTDEAQGIVFWLAAPLDQEELIRIAESLRESEPLDWVYRPTWLPGPVILVSSVEADGEGNTVYETGEGDLITFCYSKSGTTPYAEQANGQEVALKNGKAMLYSPEESGADFALTWADSKTGYAFWLISQMPVEDMIQFAESVNIYDHTINSAFDREPFGDELIMAPPCEKVRQALTDEFITSVKAYAKRDAGVGVYMQSDYHKMVNDYMKTCISPERDAAIEQVSKLMETYTDADSPPSCHVLILIEPFHFASIIASGGQTITHIYDINGRMIASYNSAGDSWIFISTLEELQFGYTVTQIYAAAFREARAQMDTAA